MKKRNLIKNKGGVGEIVALVIIVGIVLALLISVVVPMMGTAKKTAEDDMQKQELLNQKILDLNG